MFTLSNLCCFYHSIILNAPFCHCLYEAIFVVFIVQLTSRRRLVIVYIKQPLLFLLINYPQRAALAIVYVKQSLLFFSFNYPQRAV